MENLLPSREKYWKECDADQKAERCRQQIKRLKESIDKLCKIVEQLSNHAHLENKIVIPIKDNLNQCEKYYEKERDDVTF